jgi:hypothetical protein
MHMGLALNSWYIDGFHIVEMLMYTSRGVSGPQYSSAFTLLRCSVNTNLRTDSMTWMR